MQWRLSTNLSVLHCSCCVIVNCENLVMSVCWHMELFLCLSLPDQMSCDTYYLVTWLPHFSRMYNSILSWEYRRNCWEDLHSMYQLSWLVFNYYYWIVIVFLVFVLFFYYFFYYTHKFMPMKWQIECWCLCGNPSILCILFVSYFVLH